MTVPSREEILEELRCRGMNDGDIVHVTKVANFALRIADEYERRTGRTVDRRIVEVAGLVHDAGIPQCVGELITLPEYSPDVRMPTDGVMHNIWGARVARDMGLSRAIQLAVLRHTYGPTREEYREMHVPPPDDETLPETIEEDLVAAADYLIWVDRTGFDPWTDPEAAVKAGWPWTNFCFEYYAGHGIPKDHPFIRRFIDATSRWLPYARREWLAT